MCKQLKKDIFISYKNDGSGNHFACRLCRDLEDLGYSVYFNSNEELEDCFPERLQNAIENCNDFILILSSGCLEQLKQNKTVDWIREEILTAQKYKKHIIPILMEGVQMPDTIDEMPENLSFLPYIDAIKFTEQYIKSPFMLLTETLKSKTNGKELYKDTFNSNPLFDINREFSNELKKAEKGNLSAMYDVGMMCFYGLSSQEENYACRDFNSAANWLSKVAESNTELASHAQSIIARMYYQGTFPRESQSYKKAFNNHIAASKHSAYSASDVGFMLRNGIGCNFDFQRTIEYYQNNIHKGDDMAIMELAKFLTKYGKFNEAFELYNSMENISPEADYQIGILFRDGVLVSPPKPDFIQAAYYFRSAADNNHIQAAYEYGIMCFRPSGNLRKNFLEAEKYLTIAAKGGFSGAQYVLGYMYKSGHVTKDIHKAIYYLEKARAQNHSLSALELSIIYQQPECQNFQLAYECAKIASSHGVAEGEFVHGMLSLLGRGCEYDVNKAYELLSKAYQHGIHYAKIILQKIDKNYK